MDWKEQVIREVFERRVPTILLGSGASISTGLSLNLSPNFPGMPELARRLHDNVRTDGFSQDDRGAWDAFQSQFQSLGKDWWRFNLEGFLSDHPLRSDSALLHQIVEQTAQAFEAPHQALRKVIEHNPSIVYPLRTLLDRLLRAAPASRPWLSVITPNYDLMVEYSSDLIGAPCLTGFSGRILRRWMPQIGFSVPTVQQNGQRKPASCLRLIKPHGSFAWFKSKAPDNTVVECFTVGGLNGDWQRCIIAPGPSKYAESLSDVRRDHLYQMDNALTDAQSLLVIGYGFNDSHLEEHLRRSLDRGTPAIYVTRELSDEARARFVVPYEQVTCITSDGATGSRVQSGTISTFYPTDEAWRLDQFTKEFIP